MKKAVLAAAMMATILLSATALWAQSPVGKWKTVSDKTGKAESVAQIYEQNGLIYGKLVELLKPEDKGKVCSKCTGEDKDKPLLGLVFIKGLKADGDEYAGGTILAPGTGKIYKGKLKVTDGGKTLKVSGCISFVCSGQTWLKAD